MKTMRLRQEPINPEQINPEESTLEPCIIKKCKENAKWKGLCGKCYRQARLSIEKKYVESWEELAELGLCKMDEKPFMEALKAAKSSVPRNACV